jgi:hypothetical protein
VQAIVKTVTILRIPQNTGISWRDKQPRVSEEEFCSIELEKMDNTLRSYLLMKGY